jgi:hypothetical protein
LRVCTGLAHLLLREEVPIDKKAGILLYVGPKQAAQHDITGQLSLMAALQPVSVLDLSFTLMMVTVQHNYKAN